MAKTTKSGEMGEQGSVSIVAPAPRDRAAERKAAKNKQALRLGELMHDRNTGKLGDEVIKIAQAMLMCTLPYSAVEDRLITRKARLGDGSTLSVTFSAGKPGVPLPYGADRKLLAWLFDRAINSQSPSILWESAAEYTEEMGIKRSGKNNRDLRERFHRISGLHINIERKDSTSIAGKNFSIIDTYNLPSSLTGLRSNPAQQTLPGTTLMPPGSLSADMPYGVCLSPTLFEDIKNYHVAVPRSLWRQTKGASQVHDLMLWLYYRCYAAQSESMIPWAALDDQFPKDEKNPWRIRENAREAIKQLRLLWPDVKVEAKATGIWVDRAPKALLLDDPSKGRIRRG